MTSYLAEVANKNNYLRKGVTNPYERKNHILDLKRDRESKRIIKIHFDFDKWIQQ